MGAKIVLLGKPVISCRKGSPVLLNEQQQSMLKTWIEDKTTGRKTIRTIQAKAHEYGTKDEQPSRGWWKDL